jgi:formylglycine-generating enzyme required for sulfatase activity
MRLFAQTFLLFLVATLSAKEPNRTWTSADGRTIQARFIDEKKDTVRIRRTDGRVFNIPLDNLSEEDQKYVEYLAVDKPSPSTNTKYEIEDTDSKPTGNDIGEYGSKPNYIVKSALGMELIWVEPGTFTMGSPTSEAGRQTMETQHEVTLTQGFYLGKYEVTQEQYRKVMGKNPSKLKGNKLPVEMVSWNDAVAFCEALTKMELQNNYGRDDYSENKITTGSWEFNLPTEAQWEYACRAGTTTAYSWGDSISTTNANYNDIRQAVEVGSYKANPWGFFDMHGNVWEWTADWWGAYPRSSVIDPRGPNEGSYRVFRGGSWCDAGTNLRSARRGYHNPSGRTSVIGFRVGFQQQASVGSVGSSMGE